MMLGGTTSTGQRVAAVPCTGEPAAPHTGFATRLWLTRRRLGNLPTLGAAHDDPPLCWLIERVAGTQLSGVGPVRHRRIDRLTPRESPIMPMRERSDCIQLKGLFRGAAIAPDYLIAGHLSLSQG